MPLLLSVFVLGACGGANVFALQSASDVVAGATANASRVARVRSRSRVIRVARQYVAAAIPDERIQWTLRRAAYLRAAAEGDVATSARLRVHYRPRHDDLKARAAQLRLAFVAEHFDSARTLAWDAAQRFPASRAYFMRQWVRAHSADPAYAPAPVRTLPMGDALATGEHLGGGSTITMRLFDAAGETVGAFKPEQARQQSNYRSELAAYRLCPLIQCGFDVPRNEEVRLSRETVLALFGRTSRRRIAAFDRTYADLLWVEDDAGQVWLHGTLKAWVPGFRTFNIENRNHWRRLVQQGRSRVRQTPTAFLNTALTTYRRGSAPTADDTFTLDAMGSQLSNLHVFDYLTNNWDRYSRHYPGVNCQWRDGHFVSIDNGAAFPPRELHGVVARRVNTNLRQVERFSRRTIQAIRWMPVDALYPVLFSDDGRHDEKASFNDFAERRRRLLAYVDELVMRHGKAAVVCWD